MPCSLPELVVFRDLLQKPRSLVFSVEYIAAAEDGMGRLYARQSCAQRLPRILRTILYGDSHWEVDISGAHYELLRIGSKSFTLPPVRTLREHLYDVWKSTRFQEEEDEEVRKNVTPLIAGRGPPCSKLTYLRRILKGSPVSAGGPKIQVFLVLVFEEERLVI